MSDTLHSAKAAPAAAVGSAGLVTAAFGKLVRFARTQGTQPSTWRGLFLLAGALGFALSPEANEAIIAFAVAASGLIGILSDR